MMATYEEKDKRKVSDLIKQGHVIDIRKDENGEPYIVLDDMVLGLDHRVKQFIKDQLKKSRSLSDFDMKQLIYKCCIKSLRKIDKNGQPECIGVNSKTGKPIYSDWKDCFVLDVSHEKIGSLDVTKLDDYDSRQYNLLENYINVKPLEKKYKERISHDEFYDKRDMVYGEQEEWGPDTF